MNSKMLALLIVAGACRASGQAARTPIDSPQKAELSLPAVDVPLVKSGDFYFVDVVVNGQSTRFTLETGANLFAIGERLAQRLGLRIDTIPGPGGGPMAVADISTLQFSGVTLHGMRAAVNPMFNDPTFAGEGLISLPALREFVTTIDLRARRLRLERGELPNGRDVVAIAGRDRGGRVDVPITIGALALSAVIDTRSFYPLMIPDSLESSIALTGAPRSLGSAAGPSLGVFQVRGARTTSELRIADVTVEQSPIVFRNRPGVVIGVPLLEQLVITIDQRNRRARVVAADKTPITVAAQSWESGAATGGAQRVAREGPPPPAPTSGQRTMGFNLAGVPGGALAIRNVVAGSSAEKVGLKEGDQLVEFDGTRAAEMNASVFRAAATRGTPVKVVVERAGQRLELTVQPYIVP